ncbi:hypothetical protein [Paludisphaera rhizosphaerae]|uniref:hypothetical protein n=1 Tax=Paludisphaera rhizosphaerae TaxID=2711216 RepID=UPI0013ECD670|nr:hypothetical protein [Paludisphaera rhizosphaerae]
MTTRAYQSQRGGRRGVILILVLGVLGLMAVIGVTFATFTGQARIAGRSFIQSKLQPQGDEMMDFALAQLICDTNDVRSAIRGHSLARDMYGNDANRNGYLTSRSDGAQMDPASDSNFYITLANFNTPLSASTNLPCYDLTTNIPANDPLFYGYDFTRWTIRIAYVGSPISPPTTFVNQSFEVFVDSGYQPSGTGFRTLTVVLPNSENITVPNPTLGFQTTTPATYLLTYLGTNLSANLRFTLDSRWMHAFNGPGMTGNDTSIVDYDPYGSPITNPDRANKARLGNFRYNTYLPGAIGMDEDYDAVDLENWFLAMQSADGQVIIPSFHRPAAVRYDPVGVSTQSVNFTNDWSNSVDLNSRPTALREKLSRILRPRAADGHDSKTFPDLIPSDVDGKITYDVDNDGDGIMDSVWVDLGYPARRNAQGKLYKPLFAFMVIGLNGRIPLNTAGNLAGRGDSTEEAQSTHASHLGNSVSEIDPTYGLQNAFAAGYGQFDDAVDVATGTAANIDVRLTQLRNILAGTRPQVDPYNPDQTGTVNGDYNGVLMGFDALGHSRTYHMPNSVMDARDIDTSGSAATTSSTVVRFTNSVVGRWGEPDSVPGGTYAPIGANYQNEVRPGYSISVQDILLNPGYPTPADAADDNYNSFDIFPVVFNATNPNRVGEVHDADYYDAVGGLLLPVERMRRFLAPIDVNGTGLVTRFNSRSGGGGARNNNLGGDYWGRVEYRGYFRPPGLPGQVDPSTGVISYPWSPGDPFPRSRASEATVTSKTATDNNILHSYDSFLFPNTRGTPQRSGGMLAYADLTNGQVDPNTGKLAFGVPKTIPSYNGSINSGIQENFTIDDDDTGNSVSPTINSRSDGLNEADELDLYNPNTNYDAPFTHADLEWLYRSHDVDGSSLVSRLSQLAPISFTNDQDGLRRRRLYSIDTWESNAFSWVTDNPQGAFAQNHRFGQNANASMGVLGNKFYTPALAQRGRKINLNLPLPVSNDPNEPIRNKWISDAYQLMKTVLPPRAVDTPEELYQLGQYLVNLIDFRDPDCTMTHWTNPDVYYIPVAPSGTGHPSLALVGANHVEHYGMEYNPIAINETLAYTYQRKVGTNGGAVPTDTGRFFIELINTNTVPDGLDAAYSNNGSAVSLSGFDAANAGVGTPYAGSCWDLVFTSDDLNSRPDPYTGQLQPGGTVYGLTPLGQNTATSKYENATSTNGPIDILLNPLPQSKPGGGALAAKNWFGARPTVAVLTYDFPGGETAEQSSEPLAPTGQGTPALGNTIALTTVQNTDPFQANNSGTLYRLDPTYSPFCNTPSATFRIQDPNLPNVPGGILPNDQTGKVTTAAPTASIPRTAGSGKYYWVCLRRPANPLAPVSQSNPMIVVDSMRFPVIDVGGTVQTTKTDNPVGSGRFDIVTPGTNDLYSYQRLQPYRGGQAVPFEPLSTNAIDVRYGYTEQIATPLDLTNTVSTNQPRGTVLIYGDKSTQQGGDKSPQVSKGMISHSLGYPNHQTVADPVGSNPLEFWDFFPFHDRDFSSPFEVTLVPGTPPGLFTKQFAEFAPSAGNQSAFTTAAGGVLTTTAATITTKPNLAANTAADADAAAPFLFRGQTGGASEPHTFPYLIDKFFYTAVGDTAGISDTPNSTVGGYAADGWFRLFEFFEVPSQSAGAIGSVAQGTNFDWARQDVRPGMMNLNLLIDEEAFLALLGRQDMSIATGASSPSFQQQVMNPFVIQTADDLYNYGVMSTSAPNNDDRFSGGVWGLTPNRTMNTLLTAYPQSVPLTINGGTGYPATPMIVTAANAVGGPAYAQPMPSVGVIETDPVTGAVNQRMKAAFAQFLWLRHGGSGFVFGFGDGAVGQNMTVAPAAVPGTLPNPSYFLQSIPQERPFRSSTYPDVNYTMNRPAPLPPSVYTDPNLSATARDPGVRNNTHFKGYNRVDWSSSTGAGGSGATNGIIYPPPVPVRRLFQPCDGFTTSNADMRGAAFVNDITPNASTSNPVLGGLPQMYVYNPVAMTANVTTLNDDGPTLVIPHTSHPSGFPETDLGRGGSPTNPSLTQHPYFRGELMQRVLNLSTPRTHQFAVWITVGFFEVIREGDITMVGSQYPTAAFDIMGPEIGAETAQNIRYRSFFIVDRLKLTGYDPTSIGSYRPAVVYRRTIE